MTYELTDEEKVAVIDSHLKNLEYNRYNLTISVIEESAVSSPNATKVSELQADISGIDLKIAALNLEKADLEIEA